MPLYSIKVKFLFFVLVLLTPFSSYSQSFDSKKIDAFFSVLDSNNKFMGSVALLHKGNIVYSKSIGYSNVEKHIKNNDSTKYRVGSISKMFTAAMIFKAVDQGKISLDQTIDKYFPNFVFSNKIKIKDLLNHRSGLVNFSSIPNYEFYKTKKLTRAEFLDTLYMFGSERAPDQMSSYSNTNFVLLSYILQNIYTTPYHKLIQDSIITPLGLKNTFVGDTIHNELNEASSYIFDTIWKKQTETNLYIPLGAGAIVSTPQDLNQFIAALFHHKIISPKSLNSMTIIIDKYGCGIFKYPYNDKTGYGHTGGIDGFSSFLFYLPELELSLSFCSNGSNYDNNQIYYALLNHFFKKNIEIPSSSSLQSDYNERASYVGVYASLNFPYKLKITNATYFMIAQIEEDPAFSLNKVAKDIYRFEHLNIEVRFNTLNHSLIFVQNGHEYEFNKIASDTKN